MQKLQLFNSLSGKKEIFKPIVKDYVGMYVCGPTVYSNVHLGNCRTWISFDLIFRYLKHLGYKVRYVRNITDVGHLEEDSEDGEDRISKKARLEKIEPMEVVQKYTVDFFQTISLFNLLPPSIEPTATGHIIDQIELIKLIIKKGYAYEINGSVYFDVLKFNKSFNYGKLSNRKIEDLISNTRSIEGQNDKKNPQDFALWKKAEAKHIMRWPSPWSNGFPGWHLECTAMSTKYLGKKIDIHGGGLDLKFPHHECEIAQGEAITGEKQVNYWVHSNMLTLNGKKMSKSTGNNILPKDIIDGNNTFFSKSFKPEVIRFYMLQSHYRNIVDISNDALLASERGFNKLVSAINLIDNLKVSSTSNGFDLIKWEKTCYESMNDDFNSPLLLAQLFEAVKYINSVNNDKFSISNKDLIFLKNKMNTFFYEVLGLKIPNSNDKSILNNKIDGTINLLIKYREKARLNNDFETSDLIRDELLELGVKLNDSKDGTNYIIN